MEIRMRRIVHYELGEPARVLRLEEGAAPLLAPDQVRVRLSCAPVHLGGETSDIRSFPPRSLTLKGAALGSWIQQPAEQHKANIALALGLAQEPSTLFEVAEGYSPSRIADAVTHVSQAGRAGVVLIDFSKD
jgi:hypothetical protein